MGDKEIFWRSATVGPINPVSNVGHLAQGTISLKVNGVIKQIGDLNQMIWKVPEIISYLSNYFELDAGDVILTGTPSGVGPISRGNTMEIFIDKLGTLKVAVK